jgi:ADP-ribosylglycohydrolase
MKGAIIGDIVGSIYEFDNLKSKDFELFKPECEFTDDSVLTVAIAEALLNFNPDDEECCNMKQAIENFLKE